jgi:ribonuclease T1
MRIKRWFLIFATLLFLTSCEAVLNVLNESANVAATDIARTEQAQITPSAVAPRVTSPQPATTARAATPTSATAARATATPNDGLKTISSNQLPPEARKTISLIDKGGPFPYDRDGIVFQNRERLLPIKPSSYYHEYTVETPGSADRGARRIVTGENGELYYTDDHYESFKRVVR